MTVKLSEIKKVILKEDDFGHELRVGKIFENVGLDMNGMEEAFISTPEHGGTYIDRVTDKPRQFDYRCSISRRNQKTPHVQRFVHLAVECKNLNPDLPLVVCGRPRANNESFHMVLHQPQATGLGVRPIKWQEPQSIYKPMGFVGKSLVRLKVKQGDLCADGDGDIYDKWTQALASSYDLCGTSFEKSDDGYITEVFVIPVVVLPNNSLLKATYNDDGTLAGDPEPVDSCEYYLNQKIRDFGSGAYWITHIHFTTLSGFEKLLKQFVVPRTKYWKQIFGPHSE